jgi:hypothetical protein
MLSCVRMIRLLAHPFPPFSRKKIASPSKSSCVSPIELTDGRVRKVGGAAKSYNFFAIAFLRNGEKKPFVFNFVFPVSTNINRIFFFMLERNGGKMSAVRRIFAAVSDQRFRGIGVVT